jgi:hypothetical protein
LPKLLKYRLLYTANIIVSTSLILYAIEVHLIGTKLFLALVMALGGYLGAIIMYLEIRRLSKGKN